MSERPAPPPQLDWYVDAIGYDLTVRLVEEFGGAEVYLPTRPGGRSEIERLLGPEAVGALAARSAGLVVRVPTARPWLATVLKSRGLPNNQIARRLHASVTAVRRWQAAHASRPRNDPRQMKLL